jgi:type I restriction enzyme S subunit
MKRYDNYKDSGIEWIGEIPEHWDIQRLKYAFDLGTGLSITKENLIEKGVPCVNYGEIHSKYGFEVDINKHNLKCVDLNYLNTSKKALMKQGEFIFADTSEDIEGSGNFTHIKSNGDIFAGYHTITARPIKKSNSLYFAFLFDSIDYRTQIRNSVKGIKVFSITQGILKDTFIWYPPFEEQVAIANYLDHKTTQIDTLIAKKEQFISLLQEERTAVINQAVTKGLDPKAKMKDSGIEWLGEIPEHWKITKLKYHLKTTKGFAFKSDLFTDKGIPVVKASDIKNKTIRLKTTHYISEIISKEYESVRLSEGDILISTVGSTPDVIKSAVGQIGIVPFELEGALLNQNTVRLEILDKTILLNNFLFFLIQNDNYRSYLNLNAHGTANQASLKLVDILGFETSFPSIEEQQKIINLIGLELNRIDTLISKSQQEIELLKEYKTALISEVVTGKLDVRDVVLN